MVDFNKFTNYSQEILSASSALMNEYKNSELQPEHIMLAMIKDSGIIKDYLTELKLLNQGFINKVVGTVKSFPTISGPVNGQQLFLSQKTYELLDIAKQEAEKFKDEYIGIESLLLAMTLLENSNIQNILRSFGEGKINLQEAIGQIKTELSGLKGQTFVVPSEVRPDKGMVLLKTPLAELPLNNPPKLGNGLPLLLEIEGFEEVLPKVTEALTEQTAVAHNAAKNAVPDNIMKILKPLISSGQQELAAAVLNKIPEPSSPKMLANMVSYIKAGSEHNLSKWLGSEIVDKLSATKEGREVVAKLGTMFVSSNQDGINWRIMEVPVLNGQTINKIRIAVKKILDEEEKKKRKENRLYGTRFVVDTNFSRLGSFQFDGFALAKDKRFDLVIRTEKEIGSDFCANIMRLFKNTLYEEGYSGNVKINVKEKFIKVCEDNAENEFFADGIFI